MKNRKFFMTFHFSNIYLFFYEDIYVNISKGFIILYLMNMEALRNVFYVAFNYGICTKYNVDK